MTKITNSQQFIGKLLEQGIRLDGRESFQGRKTTTEFLNKNGNLLFSLGNTKVLIKTSAQIVLPRPDRPSQGFVYFRVNCTVCPNSFEQNKKNANQIQKLLEKVIVGSNCLDPESLCIQTGKFVWQINMQCIVVQDAGNIIDAILNGAVTAIMDMKRPIIKIENGSLSTGEKTLPLSIAHIPLSFSFGVYEQNIFIDPSKEEQNISETAITLSINIYNELCSIHKPGGKAISQDALSGIIRVCQKQISKMTNNLRKVVSERPKFL